MNSRERECLCSSEVQEREAVILSLEACMEEFSPTNGFHLFIGSHLVNNFDMRQFA